MEFLILGSLQIRVADRLVEIGVGKQRALLGVLLIHANQVVSADRLLEEVWGDRKPSGGVRTLRYHISKLRDALEADRDRGDEGVIGTAAGGYVLRVESGQIDVDRFEALAAEGAAALAAVDAEAARKVLVEALGLWRGGAFDDFRYDSFAQGEIARLEELRLVALENRIAVDFELGRHADVVTELRDLPIRYPLRELLWGQLMTALYRSAQQAEALRAYQAARTVLGEELGIEPNVALQRLEEQILLHELPTEPPEREALRTHNLPTRTSSFVGRSDTIADIDKLIGERRLVTLIGFAGIGKTSLEIEAARCLIGGYPDGVWLVELAPLTDPKSVVGELATVFDIRPHPTRQLLDVVVDELASKSMLLIFDNCEHLLGEAARVINVLLERCPTLRVLASSREPLRLGGEQIWPVPPLDLPTEAELSIETIGEIEAVQLFVERARQSQPGFELNDSNVEAVVRICRRLEGIPLAIELAAARLRVLSPPNLLNRLDDRFAVLVNRVSYLTAVGDLRGAHRFYVDQLPTLRNDDTLSLHLSNIVEGAPELGDYARAAEAIDEWEEAVVSMDQAMELPRVKAFRGILAFYRGDLTTAERLLVEGLGELRRLNLGDLEVYPLYHLAQVALAAGDAETAGYWARNLGNAAQRSLIARDLAAGHTLVARAALRQGSLPAAREAATEALDIADSIDDLRDLALALATIGQIAWGTRDASAAAVLHAGAEVICSRIGFVRSAARTRELEHEYTQIRTALGPDTFNSAWRTGTSLATDELVERAREVLDAVALVTQQSPAPAFGPT